MDCLRDDYFCCSACVYPCVGLIRLIDGIKAEAFAHRNEFGGHAAADS